MLAVDAGEILGILGHDLEDVIRRPRHQVTFEHVLDPPHRLFESIQNLVRLALELDLYDDRVDMPSRRGSSRAT